MIHSLRNFSRRDECLVIYSARVLEEEAEGGGDGDGLVGGTVDADGAAGLEFCGKGGVEGGGGAEAHLEFGGGGGGGVGVGGGEEGGVVGGAV